MGIDPKTRFQKTERQIKHFRPLCSAYQNNTDLIFGRAPVVFSLFMHCQCYYRYIPSLWLKCARLVGPTCNCTERR